MPDYSKLSDSDLIALKENRLQDVSNEGLLELKGIAPNQAPKVYTPTQQYMANVVEGVPFGADIASSAAAAVYGGAAPDVPFDEKRIAAKRIIEEAASQGRDTMPALSTVGALSTGAPIAMMIPSQAFQAPSIAGRAALGAGIGGSMGGVYGAGKGIGEERISNAIESGLYGAAFGAGSAIAADAISALWRGGNSLAKKAASLFDRVGQPEPNITIRANNPSQIVLQPNVAAPSQELNSGIIPLTKGQAEQDAATQALEYGAKSGAFGEQAQRMALEAADIQNEAAKAALQKTAGVELTPESGLQAATNLRNTMSQAYKAAKARTSLAYGKVAEMAPEGQLQIAGEFVKDTVVPQLDDFAKNGFNGRGFDLNSPKMVNAKRLYEQVKGFKKVQGVKSVDFFRMEDWRGRISQGIAEAEKGSPEKAFLSGLLERYDTAMKQLPREAILNGDDAIIDAMERARITRKEQGVLFERSKLVKDILTNDDITNEQFYNTISSLGDKSGTYVRDMLRTAAREPEKQAALRGQIRESVMGSILSKSLSSEVKSGSSVENLDRMISFDKLATNLEKLIKNKTLFTQVFPDKAEQDIVKQIYNSSALIKSVKPGSKNYSNTAYTLFQLLGKVSPTMQSANVLGVGVGSALKSVGEASATLSLEKSLAPVLKQVADKNAGAITNFGKTYGRQVMAAGTLQAGKNLEGNK